MPFQRLLLLTIMGGLLALVALNVNAESINCGQRPIHLAFYQYGFFYDDGVGIDKDIVDELAKRSGCKFSTELLVRARIWADLASGDLDMGTSGIQNAERDRFVWFATYLIMKNYALVRNDTATTVQNAQDFLAQPKLQLGVVRSFKHGLEQDRWISVLRLHERVQEASDVATVFKKLQEHRVDAMFSQPPVFRKYLASLNMQSEVTIQDWTPTETGVVHGLMLAKNRFNQYEAEQWRALLYAMREDGTLQRIFERYLPAPDVRQLLNF